MTKYPFIGYHDNAFWYYCNYEDRNIPRRAGFHWNKEHKCWMTRFSEVAERVMSSVKSQDKNFDLAVVKAAEQETLMLSHAVSSSFDVPAPDGEEYLPYQRAAVDFMSSRNRVLVGDQMGLGKTIESIALVNWLLQEYRPAGRVLIISPAMLKTQWRQEWMKWFTRDRYISVVSGRNGFGDSGAGTMVINYDILQGNEKKIREWGKLDLLVLDECFPAGVKIKTTKGDVDIENIAVGDEVLNATGVGTVKRIGQRRSSNLVRLHFSIYRYVDVTANHLFFTSEGWVVAKDLMGKNLLTLPGVFDIMQQDNISSQQWRYTDDYRKGLRLVRQTNDCDQEQKAFLRKVLLSEVEGSPARSNGFSKIYGKIKKGVHRFARGARPQSWLGKVFIREDENGQPSVTSRSQEKDQSALEKVWASFIKATVKRWKRETITPSSADTLGCVRGRVDGGVCNPHEETPRFGLPDVLQGRSSPTRGEGMVRGGWLESRLSREASEGQEESKAPKTVRVERVEVLKSTGDGCAPTGLGGSREVYNLEVSRHPSYFADGFLVHNCHYLKNPSAKRTKIALSLEADRVLALTGTPMPNRPIEMFTILNYLDPVAWPSRHAFALRYCNAYQGEYGWDDTGHSNLDELQRFMRSTVMIRRLKKHVLKDLPPKVRQVIEVFADCSPEMLKAVRREKTLLAHLFKKLGVDPEGNLDDESFKQVVSQLEGGDSKLFEEMPTLRRETALSKVPVVIEHLHAALADSAKIVCFAWHKDVIRKLHKEFEDCSVMIYGDTPADKRQEYVDRFQNDPTCKILIGNIKTAGTGLNLTVSNHVVFAEITWVPSDINQAEDRCHRKGTTGDSVLIQHLVLEESVDALLIQTIVAKQKVIDEAVDNEAWASLSYVLSE